MGASLHFSFFRFCVTEFSFVMQFGTAVPVMRTSLALAGQLGAGTAVGLGTEARPWCWVSSCEPGV